MTISTFPTGRSPAAAIWLSRLYGQRHLELIFTWSSARLPFRLLPRKKGGREWDGGRQDFAADGRGKTSAVGEVQTDRNFRANIVPYSDHFMERGL
jgi:hypothetical protein